MHKSGVRIFITVLFALIFAVANAASGVCAGTEAGASANIDVSASANKDVSVSVSKDFNALDAPSRWAAGDVRTAIALGLVPPNLQSKYAQSVTRAEFCALGAALFEAASGSEIEYAWEFDDTDDINVGKMAEVNVVYGVGDNKFDPDGTLTREQAAAMLARLASYIDRSRVIWREADYADRDSISDWASAYVGQMQAAGVMLGVGGSEFAPKDPYTREQSIVTMLRLYRLLSCNYDYFSADTSFTSYKDAIDYLGVNDVNVFRLNTIETEFCTFFNGYVSHGPHGDTGFLRLVYKPGSALGEGTIVSLPMPLVNGWDREEPPEDARLSPDGKTLTYSYFFEDKMEIKGGGGYIIHRAGTYSYMVDLQTGVTIIKISPIQDPNSKNKDICNTMFDLSHLNINAEPKKVIETKLSISLPVDIEIVEFDPEDKYGDFGAKIKLTKNAFIEMEDQLERFFNGKTRLEDITIPSGFKNVHYWWDLEYNNIDILYYRIICIEGYSPFDYHIYVFITKEIEDNRYMYISY